ncbi:MAG: hypothetical protein ACRD63_16965 [Pyrinomonadaceae bacterium]
MIASLLSSSFLAEGTVQLVPDGSLLIHITLILLMISLLNATLFKPIFSILEKREREKHSGFGEAEQILQDAHEKLAQYENRLHDARSEAYHLIEAERAVAVNSRQEKIAVIREQINQQLIEQKALIHTQTEEALTTLKSEAHKTAARISQNILGRSVAGVG